jgi:hypothetical protein
MQERDSSLKKLKGRGKKFISRRKEIKKIGFLPAGE